MDMYDKTSSGQQEVAANAAGLSMMERRVLILVNGEHEVGNLAKLSLCEDIDPVINRLVELEFIDVVEPTEIEAAKPAQVADDITESEAQAVTAREFMCNTLQTFGNQMRIAKLNNQIADSADLDSLKQLVQPWYEAISDTPGGMYQADDLRKEVLELLHSEELKSA